jgi:hypothetical protein
MPAASQAQRKWAFGVKGPAWAKKHHFDNPGPLPAKVAKAKSRKIKKPKKHSVGHKVKRR